ncbi:DUF4886 domain-containing protein [Sphingobacterium chuzhouense]|uniref:DUF4886 domain-containing protein n=1 Tax=Sphingobacterium chuzhouense TaxID=1742264 RepID=A0ABR7XWL1_9SPHI|nr:DUF4886 domain-containing protein [Sphingobacterium chuzhouense]MBD1423427.1 DUF4886 domain-containing protein [Sphingobacterium chuzhouense]
MRKSFLLLFTVFIQLVTIAQVSPKDDDVIKILAIGNSFSEDGIENYLHDLGSNTGKKMVIGNLYIGGAPLSLHVTNANENAEKYQYRKTGLDGKKMTTKDVSISQALSDENWDYISFQQASPLSGKYDVVMKSLPELVSYVRAKVSPETQFVYHQTWAYQHDSDHKGFANYDRDQLTMYKAIADVSKKVSKLGDFKYIIPAGTAIQNARTSSMGDTFTRDGYHLQLDYGRFTAACTWYEKIFGEDVRKNSYKPEKVTELQAKIAKEAAHKAIKKPYKVSKVKL